MTSESVKQQLATVKVGNRYAWHGGIIRVMAIGDGYAMVRYPRCVPFGIAVKELSQYEPLTKTTSPQEGR